MLPLSDLNLPPRPPLSTPMKKSKTLDPLPPQNSHTFFFSLPHDTRTRLLLAVIFIQVILLLFSRSIPFSFPSYTIHASRHPPATFTIPLPPPFSNLPPPATHPQCPHGGVYVYDMPAEFNLDLIHQCDNLDPWRSLCRALSNEGFGPPATGLTPGVVPAALASSWYSTDQFVTEILYHNRILSHPCRVTDPEKATAFYIPFYAGLAVGKYLWFNYTSRDRDRHSERMAGWLSEQPYWHRSGGWDHFLALGRISWDFRRTRDGEWGSSLIHMPVMRNITRLVIERNPWDYFDVGIPYPVGFHPGSAKDVEEWQRHVRYRKRRTLFSFVGGRRNGVTNDFRGVLMSQCGGGGRRGCRMVDCTRRRCSNGTASVLEAFLDSDFCLQPRGDSFTRRSIFDCMVAGSIPVFFWKRSAYYQYEWFLPGEGGSYSVFMDRKEVMKGMLVRSVLERYGEVEVRRMREKVIECIPRLVYGRRNQGLGDNMQDAIDVAVEGVVKRVREIEERGYKW